VTRSAKMSEVAAALSASTGCLAKYVPATFR